MAGLVGAGLPLERALTALADESENPRQRELIAHLKSEVNAGSPFARALSGAPREFDEVYCAVVAAGEQSGALGVVLEKLADDLEERQALRAKLLGAMLYPAIVSLIAIVIVIFLVTYVVPQVASVFTSSKRALPGLTVAMLAISAFVRSYGWLVLGLVVAGGTGFTLLRRNPAFRERSDAALLNLPLVGRLARGYNAARFSSTLAMLAAAGVPILKALQAAAETLGNRAMRADAMDALVQVREGAPLASAMAGEEALSRAAGDVRAAGRTDRPAAGDAGPRGHAAVGRGAAPRHGAGHDPGAAAHRRHGRGGDADRAGRAAADHPAQHLGQIALASRGCCLCEKVALTGYFPICEGHVVCLNASRPSTPQEMPTWAVGSELVPVGAHTAQIPIAQMRSVYHVGDVEKRLDKLPAREHENLRAPTNACSKRAPSVSRSSPRGCRRWTTCTTNCPTSTKCSTT